MTRTLTLLLILLSCGLASAQSDTEMHHVVLVWLKPHTSAEIADALIERTRDLASIGTVRALHVGRAIASDRPIVDDSFSFGITFTFDSEEDMHRYLTDPQHVEYVEKLLKPHLQKITVYDY